MALDNDEKKVVLSLKREKAVHPRHDAGTEGKGTLSLSGKEAEGKEAVPYAAAVPQEDEDSGWEGWGFGGGTDVNNFTLIASGGSASYGGPTYSYAVYNAPTTVPAPTSLACGAVPEPSVTAMVTVGLLTLLGVQWVTRRKRL